MRKQLLSATYYDHRVHQILPMLFSAESGESDFISEDDLNTFKGYLHYQAVDPTATSPEVLAQFRKAFDDAQETIATTPKIGRMKLRGLRPGEYRYAVVVRVGSDLLLTMWVRRDPKGDVYALMPRNRGNPHASYHRDGTFHHKSYDHQMAVSKRQPLTGDGFKGCEHFGMFAGHSPKSVGAVCDPTKFTGVLEVPPGILGPKDGFVAVDLVEPGCENQTINLYNPVHVTQVFKETEPWLVIRVGKQRRV